MLEWSDDNETSVALPPNTASPPRSTRVEEQVKKGDKVPKQWARGVPTQQAMEALEQQAEEVLEQQAEQRLMVEEMGPPP